MSDHHSLKKRLTVSAIILSFVFYIVYATPDIFFVLLNVALCGVVLYEFYTLAENKGFSPNKILGICIGLLFPVFVYFPGEPLLIVLALFIFFLINYSHDNTDSKKSFINTIITIFGLIYIAYLLSYFTKIKILYEGTKWVGYLICVTKIGDACAYFVGTKHGKTRLYGRISPNKTLEGSIGGLIGAVIFSLMFKIFIPDIAFIHFIFLGFILGIIGQLGDLTESLIKRALDAKDSGAIPGLGGMLDVVDSLLFNAPFLYFYLVFYIT